MRAQVYPDPWPGPSLGPAPPTAEETARSIVRHHVNRQYRAKQPPFPPAFYADELVEEIAAALRQRADEATRAEREALADLAAEPASGETAKVEAQILSDTLVTVQAERNAMSIRWPHSEEIIALGMVLRAASLWNRP